MSEKISLKTQWRRGIKYPTQAAETLALITSTIPLLTPALHWLANHNLEIMLNPAYLATVALSLLTLPVLTYRRLNRFTIDHNEKKITIQTECPGGRPQVRVRTKTEERNSEIVQRKIRNRLNELIQTGGKRKRVADLYFIKKRTDLNKFKRAPIVF